MDEVVEALQTVAKRSFQAAGAAKIRPLKEKGKSAKIIVDEEGKCYEVWEIGNCGHVRWSLAKAGHTASGV